MGAFAAARSFRTFTQVWISLPSCVWTRCRSDPKGATCFRRSTAEASESIGCNCRYPGEALELTPKRRRAYAMDLDANRSLIAAALGRIPAGDRAALQTV